MSINKKIRYLDNFNLKILNDEIDHYLKYLIIYESSIKNNFMMIKYLIDRNIDLKCEISEKWRPIHFICRYQNFETVKYIIDKGINLECKNNSILKKPIELIYEQKKIKSLLYFSFKKYFDY